MELKVIKTGSKGNAYLLSHDDQQLLLDAGARYGDIMQALGFWSRGLLGALITHEHQDHSKAVDSLLKHGFAVYGSQGTSHKLQATLALVKPHETQKIGNWSVLPFLVEHDAREPVGYLLYHAGTQAKILYLTDTHFCRYCFVGLTHILIECNHCEDIIFDQLDNGYLDRELFFRIKQTHLSLGRVKEFLRSCDLSCCRKIILIHLSDENSNERRMVREISDLTGIETIAAHDGQVFDFDLCPF